MNHHDLNIGMIGGGNMACALVRGLLRGGHPARLISIAEPDARRRELVAAIDPDLVIDANNTPVAQNAAVLVLAVKPQILPEVALALASQRRPARQLVMSVAAGVTLRSLAGWLGAATPLVRVMPNQPATIGAGVSALAASASVDTNGRQLAGYIAGTTGRALWLPDEALMDAVTAVSGSGPAYFYLLMEHMERAATDLGLPPELAAALTRETARFLAVYEQYKLAKDVTRRRLFLETMEQVLSQSNKVVIEQGQNGSGVVPYLPLPAIQPKPAN